MCSLTRNLPQKSINNVRIWRLILLLFLLVDQNLVTVKTTFIFFVPRSLSDSIWPSPTDDYEELPSYGVFPPEYEELLADRKKFILVELVSKDVLFHDVPEKEANMYWRDFARSVDNMDVINSVKNRRNKQHHNTPSFSTTEYFAGFQPNGGTQLFFPLQLCIPVVFNNNNHGNNFDFNLIAFCLQSSLAHQHQPSDIWSSATDFAISVIEEAMIMIREIDFAISMTHKIDFVVLANKIISGEGSITSLASAHGERLLLHQDSSYDVEETRPPATITGIILPSVNTTAPSNIADYYYADPYVDHDLPEYSFHLVNSDIFPWGMHYCLLRYVDYSNYDGGGVWKMPIMSLQSDCFSVSRRVRVIGPQMSYLSDVARVMHMHTPPFVYVTPYEEETSSYCDGGVENEDWETYCFNSSSNLSYISALHPEYVHHHYRPCLIRHNNEIVNGNECSDLSADSPYWSPHASTINLAPAHHVCSHPIRLVGSQDYGEPVDCAIGSREDGVLHGTSKSSNGYTSLSLPVPLQVAALLLITTLKYTDVRSDDDSATQLLVPTSVRQFDINCSRSNILNAYRDDFPMEDNVYSAKMHDDCDDYGVELEDGEQTAYLNADSEYGGVPDLMDSDQTARFNVNVADLSTQEDDDDHPQYCISQNIRRVKKGDLVNRGANGDVQGGNLRIISEFLRTICEISGVYVDIPDVVDEKSITCGDMCVTQLQPIIINSRQCATPDLPRCSFSFAFVIADGSYWFKAQFYHPNSQTSRISNMYWTHFIACKIFCCHQASELGAIFFDIEAWGEILCCLFCEDGRSHYMSGVRLLIGCWSVTSCVPAWRDFVSYDSMVDFAVNTMAPTISYDVACIDVKTYVDAKSCNSSCERFLWCALVDFLEILCNRMDMLHLAFSYDQLHYPCHFADDLEKDMRYRETIGSLISDRAQAGISARGYLRALQMELLRALQQHFNWIMDGKLHAITYSHLVRTTRDATVLRDDNVEDVCLEGNVLERISADRSSLYDVCAWFDTTTAAASHGIGALPVKCSGHPTSCHLDRIKRLKLETKQTGYHCTSTNVHRPRRDNIDSTVDSRANKTDYTTYVMMCDVSSIHVKPYGNVMMSHNSCGRPLYHVSISDLSVSLHCRLGILMCRSSMNYLKFLLWKHWNDMLSTSLDKLLGLVLQRNVKYAASYTSSEVACGGYCFDQPSNNVIGSPYKPSRYGKEHSGVISSGGYYPMHNSHLMHLVRSQDHGEPIGWILRWRRKNDELIDCIVKPRKHGERIVCTITPQHSLLHRDVAIHTIATRIESITETSSSVDDNINSYMETTYVIKMEHVLICYRTGMPDIADVDWGTKVTSSVEVCEHNTAWTATSAVMICASPPFAIILSRRLPLLSIQLHSLDVYLSGNTDDSLDNGTSYQFPTSCCFGIRITPRFCEHGSADSTKIPSFAPSTEYGEHLLWIMGMIFDVNSIRCVVDCTENHSLHGITGVLMQQLLEHGCDGYTQQLMDWAYYYSPHRRSVIMAPFDANLSASVRSYNDHTSTSNVITTNGELRSFAMESDMSLVRHHEGILSSALVTRCTAASIAFMSMAYASCIDMNNDMSLRPRYTAYGMRPFIFDDMLELTACITMPHRLDILATNARNNLVTLGNWHVRNLNVRNHQIASLHQCHLVTLRQREHHHILHDTQTHNLICGFELGHDDILHEHWICPYLIFGLMIGLIMLLQCATRNHTLQTAGLAISISSRRGVTPRMDVRVCTDLIPICKYMCIGK